MYINKEGKEVPNPDQKSGFFTLVAALIFVRGLYIKSRSGALVKANVPPDHLAYQIGETAQIHSGGILQATPHCVKAAEV
jgi:isopenicillin N synthase-like dioxygenase